MAFQKPSIPKGTRDFTPHEMVRRIYIFDLIRKIFQTFGYQPIETPAMENLTTLMGKYGVEGDKLLFKILNSGNFLDKVQDVNYELRLPAGKAGITNYKKGFPDYKEFTTLIAEKGLRYDLTVPFARFVVQHQNELTFPFKRYQIQPVWRADRPQKGRYREFFQCDVDVIGSDSLLYEVELIQIIDEIFSQLGMNVLIRINNRKILAGVAEVMGDVTKLNDITVAMDKLDKTGIEKVNEELLQKGISIEGIERLKPLLLLEGKLKEKMDFLSDFLSDSEIGRIGIEELLLVKNYLKDLELKNKFDLDVRLARGLDYYTGTIIEVKALDVPIGSVCGGGRYDDLTGIFGLGGVSGVGISFGADRIYDVMNELILFPENLESTTRVLFLNFGAEEEKLCLQLLSQCRKEGIASEIYPQNAKLKKQLDYANKKNIPFVVFIGKEEMDSGKLTVKNMKTGDQQKMAFEELKTFLRLG
jgi:histidyl-tRNA synthetase